jgi:hypothetical protein
MDNTLEKLVDNQLFTLNLRRTKLGAHFILTGYRY